MEKYRTEERLQPDLCSSANNITDSFTLAGVQNPASVLAVTGTGSIYAGMPRTFFDDVRFAFR